jgi:outer membrane protein TolC
MVELARATRWTPKLTGTALLGGVPSARGDIFSSPDTGRDFGDLGLFWRVRLDTSLPVFTFGRLKGAQLAAEALEASKAAKVEATRKTAHQLAARAYFGCLLAQESLALIREVRGRLERAISKLENPEPGAADPDPLDLYRAHSYGFELDQRETQAERELAVAAEGLRLLVGQPVGAEVRPTADQLVALEAPLPDLEVGFHEASERRAEAREAALAARAKELWAGVTAKERYPTLNLEGRFEYGAAPNRERQDNPFIYDPFNVRTLSAALAIRWDLSFAQTGARAAEEAAEAAGLWAQHQAVLAELHFEVAEAHARLAQADKDYATSLRALSTAASWLRAAEEGQTLGTASLRDLVEAFGATIRMRGAQLQATLDLDLALIGWRLALGYPPLAESEAP